MTGRDTYLLLYRPGPAWLRGRPLAEQPLGPHAQHMLSLYQSGILTFAGPFLDTGGGAAAIEVDSETEVRKIIAFDPAVRSGLMVVQSHRWSLIDWHTRLAHGAG